MNHQVFPIYKALVFFFANFMPLWFLSFFLYNGAMTMRVDP